MIVDDQHTDRSVIAIGDVQRVQPDTSMRPSAPSLRR
jgi:hypothetical protein